MRTRLSRASSVGTRVTGVAMVMAVSAALTVGILPSPPGTEGRDLRLALVGCSVVCVLVWMTVSVRARRVGGVELDKPARPERRPSRWLPLLLAVLLPLASGAALVQAVGPDGERGRWVAEVYAAGGQVHEVRIDGVVSGPRPTGVNVNGIDEYAADVVVTLGFEDSPRGTTVRGARTLGVPQKGDTVSVLYAPARPGLGGRYHGSGFFSGGGVALLWIWAVTLFAAAFGCGILDRARVHAARRFRGDVHGVAALLLGLGVLCLLPGTFFQTPTWAGWLLSFLAACTPWLAMTWTVKRLGRAHCPAGAV
ncbi:hypothetical protein [Streptomyces rubiginosohelvolus]|uniref:hypothetical protein n=1 Tax=Streptomyces rubiginosohelvolus TaxID=67362 RepID=UPI0036E9FE32